MNYYLAVDIGASSGRMILSHMEKKKIILEEIHRFENGMKKKGGHLVWDTEMLFCEILDGMKKCKKLDKVPKSMGIDTWEVDYVFLDENDQMVGDAVGYRDRRTVGMDAKVYEKIDENQLYATTGIQKQMFNTIYQLMSVKLYEPLLMEKAKSMLLIPDYFHFLLTGRKVTEYTNATTTQLLNPITKNWDYKLIDSLGFKREIFQKIGMPGEKVGVLTPEIEQIVGFSCRVILPATHDTASAVMAVPSVGDDTLYISSGTWSLMGTEINEAICSQKSKELNFTNEGGYNCKYRFLKNIMGMWMINSVRRELAPERTFQKICEEAEKQTITSVVDANAERFLAPGSMAEEVQKACRETGQQIPKGIDEIAAVIYRSLAQCYAKTSREIEEITGKTFGCIYVIGGGANAAYLNKITAQACGKKVLAGPVEATAIGNIVSQMIASSELKDLTEARSCIRESFPIKEYSGL